jgi:hypothetical protein
MADVHAGTMAKATAYAEFAEAAGWVPVIAVDGDLITCTTTRGGETIVIHWQGSRFVDDARYTYGSRNIALRNVSHARQKMGDSADVAAKEVATVRKGRSRKAADHDTDEVRAVKRRALPFDCNTSTDEEVFAALGGKTIIWRNSRTRETESATVAINPGQHLLRIDVKGDRRAFTFVSAKGPFRSIYLDAILEVK